MDTYDRLDWHYDSAVAAGQPPENAFTHIGFFLAWIIHHGMHNRRSFPASHVAAVKGGEMTGSDLSDDIDMKLLPGDMNAEGRAFSDARYSAYLAEYRAAFADRPDYSVTDDLDNYELIAPVIDSLYASWVTDGRPKPHLEEAVDHKMLTPDMPPGLDISPDMSSDEIAALMADVAARLGGVVVSRPTRDEMSHAAPDLEALIPRDLTSPPLDVSSVSASDWQSSLLNRALKRLETRPQDAMVVNGMGGPGEQVLTVTLYGVPGVAAGRLSAEFGSTIYLPPRAKWSEREIAGRLVNWAEGREFTVAFWTRDGLVVHLAGRAADVERAIPRLP